GLGQFIAQPIGASPDGGTWVGFARDSSVGFTESFSQTVGGFVVGQSYNVSWYVGLFGYSGGPGYGQPNAIQLFANGVSGGTGATHSPDRLWFSDGISFVASAASLNLEFRLAAAGASYMSIDVISITDGSATVPEPGTLALLGGGLMLAAARLRRRR